MTLIVEADGGLAYVDRRIPDVEQNFEAHLRSLGLSSDDLDVTQSVRAISTWFEQEPLTDIVPIAEDGDWITIGWGTSTYSAPEFAYSIERTFVIADLEGDNAFHTLQFTFSTKTGKALSIGADAIVCDQIVGLDDCIQTALEHPAAAFVQANPNPLFEYSLYNSG